MAKQDRRKADVVTLKVDPSLVEAMKHMPNRSAFIRTAILNALDSTCPLCQGTGVLTPTQREHWTEFARSHAVKECDACNELRLICDNEPKRRKRTRRCAAGT